MVIAERAHTSRLVGRRSGIHFEAVEDAVNVRERSGRIEHITALGETTSAQKRVNEARLHCRRNRAWRGTAQVSQVSRETGTPARLIGHFRSADRANRTH